MNLVKGSCDPCSALALAHVVFRAMRCCCWPMCFVQQSACALLILSICCAGRGGADADGCGIGSAVGNCQLRVLTLAVQAEAVLMLTGVVLGPQSVTANCEC